MKSNLQLKLTVRLCTEDGTRGFGPGIAALLHQVEERHSLRAAAIAMGMAYSKAWRIVRTAEGIFGFPLLRSTIGGPHGGGAVLTTEGARVLAAYDALAADVVQYGRRRFEEALVSFSSPTTQ